MTINEKQIDYVHSMHEKKQLFGFFDPMSVKEFECQRTIYDVKMMLKTIIEYAIP